MNRAAFTLIEVMAVVLLLGLLAGATAWSLAGQVEEATQKEMLDQLAHTDRLARTAGQRMGRPVTLHLDLAEQRMWWIVGQGVSAERSAVLRLPEMLRLDRVRIAPAAEPPAGSQQPYVRGGSFDAGVVRVPLSTTGTSPTYALRLTDRRTNDSHWLLIAGLTGQTDLTDDPTQIDNLFAALATGRPDAD